MVLCITVHAQNICCSISTGLDLFKSSNDIKRCSKWYCANSHRLLLIGWSSVLWLVHSFVFFSLNQPGLCIVMCIFLKSKLQTNFICIRFDQSSNVHILIKLVIVSYDRNGKMFCELYFKKLLLVVMLGSMLYLHLHLGRALFFIAVLAVCRSTSQVTDCTVPSSSNWRAAVIKLSLLAALVKLFVWSAQL